MNPGAPPAPSGPPPRGAVLSRERRAVELARLVSPDAPATAYPAALVLTAVERDRGLGLVAHLVRALLDLASVAEALVPAEPWPEDRGTDAAREVAVRLCALADRLDGLADRLPAGGDDGGGA